MGQRTGHHHLWRFEPVGSYHRRILWPLTIHRPCRALRLAIRDPFDQTTLASGGNSSAVAMPHGVRTTNSCVCRLLRSTLLEGKEDALVFRVMVSWTR